MASTCCADSSVAYGKALQKPHVCDFPARELMAHRVNRYKGELP
jgi:hypothetical protein